MPPVTTTTAPTPRPDGASLERRLPLLISGLLLLVVTTYCAAAYREVRHAATVAAVERLGRQSRQLADLAQSSGNARAAAVRAAVADTGLRAALREGRDPAAALQRVTAMLGYDSTLVATELWSVEGQRLAHLGDTLSATDSDVLRELLSAAPRGDTVRSSPLFADAGRAYTWTIHPVADGARRRGWFLQLRRVADNPAVERSIQELVGSDASVYFAGAAGDLWTTLRGRPVHPLLPLAPRDSTFEATTATGERVVVGQALVGGAPIWIVVAMPRRAMLQRPMLFLVRMLGIGTLLLVAGALGAWLLSRHVTRPLRVVTEAAEAVAGGDYGQRVTLRRDDELGRLARTFNTMAQRIGVTRDELARRADESAALAGSMRQLNAELAAAQDETLRAVGRTERLQKVAAALAGALDRDQVTGVIIEHGVQAAEAVAGSLVLHVGDGLEIIGSQGYPEGHIAPFRHMRLDAKLPATEALRTGEAVYLASYEEWRDRYGEPPTLAETRGWAALPLTARGRTFAVLALSFATVRRFDEATRGFLLALAQLCAQALDRALLFDAAVHARDDAELARATAQAANEAKSRFLAMMSHELRTPLNAIGGYAELLAMELRGPVTDAQRADLERIQHSQQHLLAIISDLLNLAQIEAGRLTMRSTAVPVGEVLAGVEALIAPQVAAKGLRYEVGDCSPTLAVHADRERLRQVVLNIVSNAVRFTDAGGISVHCEGDGEVVRLRVTDTGIGIPRDRLEKIFEPFVQVDSGLTRRTGGTGLGLAISRQLVAAMGGSIAVASEIGRGSTFTLTLPRAGTSLDEAADVDVPTLSTRSTPG